jgi:hypothetical protein
MKVVGAIFALTVSIVSAPFARAADEPLVRQVVRNVVALYQGDAHLRKYNGIQLKFIEEDVVNAQADYDGKNATVSFFRKLLTDMTADEVIIAACHELGHVLGGMPPHRIGQGDERDPLSIEGEADYFAGRCAVQYYRDIEGIDTAGAQEKTFFAAVGLFEKLYEVRVNAQKAQTDRYKGVNLGYPEPSCRALSVWSGAERVRRPACWYNPRG